MPTLTAITVRAASRQPIGVGGFQEASVSLAFSVAEGDPALDRLADHVARELEAAFARLWAKLEGTPGSEDKPLYRPPTRTAKGGVSHDRSG